MSSLDQAESRSSRMYAEGNFDGAQKVYEAWIRDNEKDCAAIDLAKALNNLGHAKYMQVDFDGAIEDYDRAISACPGGLTAAYYNRGLVLYRLGQFHRAMKDLTTAVERSPDNTDFKEALQACQKSIQTPVQ